jgi:hypothetical protein
MMAAPPAGTVIGDHRLEVDPIVEFGYLTVTTDGKTLTVTFKTAPRGGPVAQQDFVTLDLAKGQITASGGGGGGGKHGPGPPPPKPGGGHKAPNPVKKKH